MQLLLLLLLRVGTALVGVRVAVPLLVPLVVVEVVAHLADCLGAGGLVLDWHLGETGVGVEFDVTSVEYVLVVVVDLDVFVAGDALVVVAGDCAALDLAQLLQLVAHLVGLGLFRVVGLRLRLSLVLFLV